MDEDSDDLLYRQRLLVGRLRRHAVSCLAVGFVQELYAVVDEADVHDRLTAIAAEYGVPVWTLAEAMITTPECGTTRWLTPPATAEPVLSFVPASAGGPLTVELVADRLLHRAVDITDAAAGNVQLPVALTGDLRLEAHLGHDERFLHFFALVGGSGSACALASRTGRGVRIRDVATDPTYTAQSRAVMLRSGSRSCHSVPLTTASGLHGMVSTHFTYPNASLSRQQEQALNQAALEAATWLDWHHRTVVLGAVGRVHHFFARPN